MNEAPFPSGTSSLPDPAVTDAPVSSDPTSHNADSAQPESARTPNYPSARDWWVYDTWTNRCSSMADVGRLCCCSLPEAMQSIQSVNDWLRREVFSDQPRLRIRHAMTLDHMSRQIQRRWSDSGEVRLLPELRRFLGTLSTFLGLDEVHTPEPAVESPELTRVAGKGRAESLRSQADALLRIADSLDRPEAKVSREAG